MVLLCVIEEPKQRQENHTFFKENYAIIGLPEKFEDNQIPRVFQESFTIF